MSAFEDYWREAEDSPGEYKSIKDVALQAWNAAIKSMEGSPSAFDNKESVQCQHAFYAVRYANKVRCNCKAEFPLISTC